MFENIFSKNQEKEVKEKPKQKIIADIHEKNSLVISELVLLGTKVEFKKLEVGDYIINDVLIERKTARDFLSSMISKRLQNQLFSLKQYPRPLLIIENFPEVYDTNINTNAIRGFVMSILLDIKIPILITEDYQDTAHYLHTLARKHPRGHISIRVKRKILSKKEQLQFILEGFPRVGPATSKKLLKKFKNIKNIINATEEELKEILGKKTGLFREIIGKVY